MGQDGIDTLYNAFFRDCVEWLARPSISLLKSEEIKAKFKEWKGRYLLLPQWIGFSLQYQNNLISTIAEHYFERQESEAQLSQFSDSSKRALVVLGEQGIGKSALISRFMGHHRRTDSDYLIIDIKQILLNLYSESLSLELLDAFRYSTACKIIIFDNTEAILTVSELTLHRFEQLVSTIPSQVKIIFLYQTANLAISGNLFGIPQEQVELLNLFPLNKREIITKFPFLTSLSSPNNLTFYAYSEPKEILDSFICHPFYLKLIVNYYMQFKSLKINFSSTENFIDNILKALLTPTQLKLCCRLIYLISQNKNTRELVQEPGFSELIARGIFRQEPNNSYGFSHSIYLEWALRYATEFYIASLIDADNTIPFIYEEIFRVLPSHRAESSAFLALNPTLEKYYAKTERTLQLSNSALFYLTHLVSTRSLAILSQYDWFLYLLVDNSPIELLDFMKTWFSNDSFRSILSSDNALQSLLSTCAIRCLCISNKLIKTGYLFYQIASLHSELSPELRDCFSFYMDNFVDLFASRYTIGLMSFKSKLRFLNEYCASSPTTMRDYCYFQHVYDGLLKAADSGEIGNASYPGNNVYLRNRMAKYYHGYINYRGEHFPFDPEKGSEREPEEISYHFKAMGLLFNLVVQKLNAKGYLDCVKPEHLVSVLEANLALNLDDEPQKLQSIREMSQTIYSLLEPESPLRDKLQEISQIVDSRKLSPNDIFE